MRVTVLFCWLYATLAVVGLNTATPFEILVMYNAYLAEQRAAKLGGYTPIMATGLKHNPANWNDASAAADEAAFKASVEAAGIDGVAAIDEFVKGFGDPRTFENFAFSAVGHTINPSWSSWQQKMAASQLGDGKGPNAFKYDYQVLFPDVFLSSKGNPTRPPFGDIFDKIDSIYSEINSLGFVGDDFITQCLTNSKEFARVAQGYRALDLQTWLQKSLPNSIFSVVALKTDEVQKPFSSSDPLFSYDNVDFSKSLSSLATPNGNLPESTRAQIVSLGNQFFALKSTRVHTNIMGAMQRSINRANAFLKYCPK